MEIYISWEINLYAASHTVAEVRVMCLVLKWYDGCENFNQGLEIGISLASADAVVVVAVL